jgi:hypothetical protein
LTGSCRRAIVRVAVPSLKQTRALLARMWSVPASLSYLQPDLTDAAVAETEQALGVRLPKAYLAALRVQNGGYMRLIRHPSGVEVDCIAGVNGRGAAYPSLPLSDWSAEKATMLEEGLTSPERIDLLVPFCGDGHQYVCFDYRRSGRRREPAITLVDVESFHIDRVIAPSFLALLGALGPDREEPAVGLLTRKNAARVATDVSRALRCTFIDQGTQGHGYRSFVARVGRDRKTLLWIGANQTTRGWVSHPRRYRGQHPEWLGQAVDRYPEHADCGYFVTCSDHGSSAGRRALAALAKLPFETRRIDRLA